MDRTIRPFTIDQTWRLVDLPGYGFAQVARQDKAQFNEAVNEYLLERANLLRVFALIDSGLPPQEIDVEFVAWLAENSIPFVLVFTKTDKVSAAKVQANIASFKERMFGRCETMPDILTCSTTARQGRGELLKVIQEAIATN